METSFFFSRKFGCFSIHILFLLGFFFCDWTDRFQIFISLTNKHFLSLPAYQSTDNNEPPEDTSERLFCILVIFVGKWNFPRIFIQVHVTFWNSTCNGVENWKLFFGVFLIATVIGEIGSLINNMNVSAQLFRQKLDVLNMFMANRRIPWELSQRIQMYYDHLWSRQQGLDDSTILKDCRLGVWFTH